MSWAPEQTSGIRLGSCWQSIGMDSPEQHFSGVAYRAQQWEVLASLDQAFDLAYRRLRQAARASWERSVGMTKDPSDGCVSVTVDHPKPDQRKSARGSGFLPRKASEPSGESRGRRVARIPRYAH